MHNKSTFLDNDEAFLLFDNLTVEIHVWKIIHGQNKQIKTWQLIYVNPPALKSWGFESLDKIKGKTTEEIFGADAIEHYMPIVSKIMEENKPHTFQDYFPHLKKHFRFTSLPIGEYFITTGNDITEFVEEQKSMKDVNRALEQEIVERKKMENSLQESEATFRALFEQAGGYCMILQPTCSGIPNIIDVNEAACLEHGYSRSEMIGKPVAELDDEEGKKACIDRTKIIMSGKPLVIETMHVRKDGSTFPVLVCANLIQIGNTPPLIFSTEHNISEIKNAETKRKHAEETSRQNLVRLSHFSRLHTANELATGIAHELNQPLSAINTFASAGLKLMQGSNNNPALLSDALKGIARQAMRAGMLVNRIRK
jgi:PAS domain S-box-containing protein